MTDNQQIIKDSKQKLKEALNSDADAHDLLVSGWGADKVPGFEFVEHYGGEGQGEAYWSVFKYDGVYFRISGYYMSYDGADIDVWDWQVVKPVQVQRTEYKAA